MKARSRQLPPCGYTLVEVLASAGIISAAIGAAAALSNSITKQEEMTRGQMAAVRYAENIARLWQLGINPSSVMLSQPQGAEGSTGLNPMTYSVATPTTISLGNDGGIDQGTVEKTTISVNWLPYGSSTQNTFTVDAIRPVAAHR